MNTKREHVPMTPLQRDQWLAERVKLLEPDSEIRAREYYERPPLPKGLSWWPFEGMVISDWSVFRESSHEETHV